MGRCIRQNQERLQLRRIHLLWKIRGRDVKERPGCAAERIFARWAIRVIETRRIPVSSTDGIPAQLLLERCCSACAK